VSCLAAAALRFIVLIVILAGVIEGPIRAKQGGRVNRNVTVSKVRPFDVCNRFQP
jgi:hypothetical protein